MNIAQLKAFIEVVDRGSFSEAARHLGVSQPAVTMQVQALESDIGATLFERRYRRIDLTEAGQALLPRARRILAEIEDARDEIDHMSGTVTGRLVIAASTAPGQYVLPKILGGFLGKYPEVGVGIVIGDTSSVVEQVHSGEAQLGMVGAKIRGVDVAFEELGTDELLMICHPENPLRTQKGLLLGALVDEPFIMREPGSGTRQIVEAALHAENVDPGDLRVVTELGTSEAIVRAVEGGLGISAVSRWVAEKALALGTIAEVPVGGFPLARPFYVVTPRGTLSRAAEAFLGHLRVSV